MREYKYCNKESPPMNENYLENYLLDTQLIKIVRAAGALALKEQQNLKVMLKADGSDVTNGDLAVSHYLTVELLKLYPNYEIFSEEDSEKIPVEDQVIVIDPIDGTKSYKNKEQTWSILIAFMSGHSPKVGVVYQPTLNRLYWAKPGLGAYLLEGDNEPVKLSAKKSLPKKGIYSLTNFGELEFLQSLGISADRMYSASLKIMEVASGRYDLYPNFQKGCSLWDLLAPELILTEAGGSMIYENKFLFNYTSPRVSLKFLAAGPNINPNEISNLFGPIFP